MGFFKSFKDRLSQDYGGRYVAIVLKELFLGSPAAAKAVFGRDIDFDTVDVEVSLGTFGGGLRSERRADIALFSVDREIVALVELKYEDQKNERNHAQLADYIKFLRRYGGKRPPPLVVITKSPLPEGEERLIRRHSAIVNCISYGEVVCRIRHLAAGSPVVKMVVEYLEEEAPMFRKIDKDALQLLMLNALNVNGGLGRQHTHAKIEAAPQMLANLIENMSILGDAFHHGCAPGKVRPIPRFIFVPEVKASDWDSAGKHINDRGRIEPRRIHSGNLWVYYRFNLYKWRAVLELGFGVKLDVNLKNPLKTFLYAEVWHRKQRESDFLSKVVNLERLAEYKAEKILNGLAKKTIKQALDRSLDRSARTNLAYMRRRLVKV